MITIGQIKAARALLNWSQDDLARAAGISLPALGNLERNATQPRLRTAQAIEKALTDGGVEFIEGPGVRLQQDVLKINMLEGKDAIARLFSDIYAHMRQTGGDLLVGGVNEKQFLKSDGATPLVEYLKKSSPAQVFTCPGAGMRRGCAFSGAPTNIHLPLAGQGKLWPGSLLHIQG